MKFPSVFKISSSTVKTVQAFWNLDHGQFEVRDCKKCNYKIYAKFWLFFMLFVCTQNIVHSTSVLNYVDRSILSFYFCYHLTLAIFRRDYSEDKKRGDFISKANLPYFTMLLSLFTCELRYR